MNEWLILVGFIVTCFAAALAGAFFPPGPWYERVRKPRWNPPKWVFAPAWTLLYILMGVAGWLAWRQMGFGLPLAVFGIQLVLNFLWTAIFFGAKRPDLAFYEIVVLWLAILACVLLFAPSSPWGAGLMLPYLAWVTFAAALNFEIMRLNPGPGPREPSTQAGS
ncbi:TspO/MBR family protein [Roseococcus sp. YIM B11640]|uniref:TspO/MBR family protein n=1 Tax=Roseococcus sp. YIM B11640 TaxID=3133973 RepID=UPI003C7C7115